MGPKTWSLTDEAVGTLVKICADRLPQQVIEELAEQGYFSVDFSYLVIEEETESVLDKREVATLGMLANKISMRELLIQALKAIQSEIMAVPSRDTITLDNRYLVPANLTHDDWDELVILLNRLGFKATMSVLEDGPYKMPVLEISSRFPPVVYRAAFSAETIAYLLK